MLFSIRSAFFIVILTAKKCQQPSAPNSDSTCRLVCCGSMTDRNIACLFWATDDLVKQSKKERQEQKKEKMGKKAGPGGKTNGEPGKLKGQKRQEKKVNCEKNVFSRSLMCLQGLKKQQKPTKAQQSQQKAQQVTARGKAAREQTVNARRGIEPKSPRSPAQTTPLSSRTRTAAQRIRQRARGGAAAPYGLI